MLTMCFDVQGGRIVPVIKRITLDDTSEICGECGENLSMQHCTCAADVRDELESLGFYWSDVRNVWVNGQWHILTEKTLNWKSGFMLIFNSDDSQDRDTKEFATPREFFEWWSYDKR